VPTPLIVDLEFAMEAVPFVDSTFIIGPAFPSSLWRGSIELIEEFPLWWQIRRCCELPDVLGTGAGEVGDILPVLVAVAMPAPTTTTATTVSVTGAVATSATAAKPTATGPAWRANSRASSPNSPEGPRGSSGYS